MDLYPSWLGPSGEGDPYPMPLDAVSVEITDALSAQVVPLDMVAVATSQFEIEVTGSTEVAVSLPSDLEVDLSGLPEA